MLYLYFVKLNNGLKGIITVFTYLHFTVMIQIIIIVLIPFCIDSYTHGHCSMEASATANHDQPFATLNFLQVILQPTKNH